MISDIDVAPRDGQWDLLEAYNRILRPTGYPRLAATADVTGVLASVFDQVRRDILAEGWRFNSSFQTFTETVNEPGDSSPLVVDFEARAPGLQYVGFPFQVQEVWWAGSSPPDITIELEANLVSDSLAVAGSNVRLYSNTARIPDGNETDEQIVFFGNTPVLLVRTLTSPQNFAGSFAWGNHAPTDFQLWYQIQVLPESNNLSEQRFGATIQINDRWRSLPGRYISAESRRDGIVLRGDSLWDLERDALALNYPYSLSVAEDVAFEDMPPLAQSYLVARAARVYWAYTSFNSTIAQALSVFELRTRASLIKAEGEPIILRNPYSGPGAYRAVTYSDVGRHYGTEGQALGQNY